MALDTPVLAEVCPLVVVVINCIYPAAYRDPNGSRRLLGFYIYDRIPVPDQKSSAKPCGALLSKWGYRCFDKMVKTSNFIRTDQIDGLEAMI